MLTFDQATDFIDSESRSIWFLLNKQFNCGEIPRIDFEIKKSKTAGFAFYNPKKGILFNLAYFCTHENMQDLKEVIAHELSHIVQYRVFPQAKQAHGIEFRFIMQQIGFTGDTYHYMSVSKAKAAISSIKESIISKDDF